MNVKLAHFYCARIKAGKTLKLYLTSEYIIICICYRMTLIIVQILSILVLAWPAACQFLNGFGEDVEFNCLPGHAIDTIESNQISNIQKRRKRTDEYDREWKFDCIQVSWFLCVWYQLHYSHIAICLCIQSMLYTYCGHLYIPVYIFLMCNSYPIHIG